jgi:two-component system, NtrC family, nitrogen regulation sensor histidine kinase NtrY
VTLGQRLLLAIAAVTIVITGLSGTAVREAWRSAEEQRFAEEFRAALEPLSRELGSELGEIGPLVEPVCKHDPILDTALVGLSSGNLADYRLSISLRVPELAKALNLDELLLVTSRGDVLGAHAEGIVGQRRPELARRMEAGGRAVVREGTPLAIEFACLRKDPGDRRHFVGLYAARHLDPLFTRVGAAFGVTLQRESRFGDDVMSQELAMPELGALKIAAVRSRVPLLVALGQLDATLLAIGIGTLGFALVAAWLLSRGLARPIVEMARQAQKVPFGEPKPVLGAGGRELEEFAAAYNQAIADLVELRKRLAATERIAARREIARRVAHEIKNPLAPIRAAVETLRRLRARADPAFDEYFDEATRTVLDEVNRISNIVSEFTKFARLPPPAPAPMKLLETARSVVLLHASSGAKLTLVGDVEVEIVADRDQVVQVLTNLIQNALDAVREVPQPSVVVSVERAADERALLRVRDNGAGVSPEVERRLFEPYLTTKPEGTGLGLAIVQRIVLEHGGDIELKTPPEGGAEFVVSLPVSGPPMLPEPMPPSSISAGGAM